MLASTLGTEGLQVVRRGNILETVVVVVASHKLAAAVKHLLWETVAVQGTTVGAEKVPVQQQRGPEAVVQQ